MSRICSTCSAEATPTGVTYHDRAKYVAHSFQCPECEELFAQVMREAGAAAASKIDERVYQALTKALK